MAIMLLEDGKMLYKKHVIVASSDIWHTVYQDCIRGSNGESAHESDHLKKKLNFSGFSVIFFFTEPSSDVLDRRVHPYTHMIIGREYSLSSLSSFP